MSEEFPRGGASPCVDFPFSVRPSPTPTRSTPAANGPSDVAILARMCEALGDTARLQTFRRIAAFGLDGIDAAELDDEDAVAVLVAAAVVTPVIVRGQRRYRAEGRRLAVALGRLKGPPLA